MIEILTVHTKNMWHSTFSRDQDIMEMSFVEKFWEKDRNSLRIWFINIIFSTDLIKLNILYMLTYVVSHL